MKELIISIFYLLSFMAQANDVIYIKEKKFDGYIFSKDHFALISIENQKGRYTPTKEEIMEIEKLLQKQLCKINKSLINQGNDCPIIHKSLNNYTRQYVGFINQNGDKIIWINFIWKTKSNDDNLSKEIFSASDGCSHYWNVKVNLTIKKVFALHVNGLG